MKCPVCKNEIELNITQCPVCGFDDIRAEFISAEDATVWMDTVVIRFREKWETQKNILDEKNEVAVIGIGGAGLNGINRIAEQVNAFFVAIDSESENMKSCKADMSITIHDTIVEGEITNDCEIISKLNQIANKYSVIIIYAGLGGQIGSTITPIIAKWFKEQHKTLVVITTKPFRFEGNIRLNKATKSNDAISEFSDYHITVSNDKLLNNANISRNGSLSEAFSYVDRMVASVTEIMKHIIKNNDIGNAEKLKWKLEKVMAEYGITE